MALASENPSFDDGFERRHRQGDDGDEIWEDLDESPWVAIGFQREHSVWENIFEDHIEEMGQEDTYSDPDVRDWLIHTRPGNLPWKEGTLTLHEQRGVFMNTLSDRTMGSEELEIEISEDDLYGQFRKVKEELSISETELRLVEIAIREFVAEKAEEYKLDWDENMEDATANVLASVLLQEYKELS